MRRQNRHRSATVRRPAAMWIAAGGWSNPAWLNVRALLRPGFTTALRQHSRPGKVSTPHPGPLLVWRGEGKTTAASLENRVAGQAASLFHQPAENPKEFRPKTEGCSVAAYPGYALFQPMDKLEEFCPASRETGRQAVAPHWKNHPPISSRTLAAMSPCRTRDSPTRIAPEPHCCRRFTSAGV